MRQYACEPPAEFLMTVVQKCPALRTRPDAIIECYPCPRSRHARSPHRHFRSRQSRRYPHPHSDPGSAAAPAFSISARLSFTTRCHWPARGTDRRVEVVVVVDGAVARSAPARCRHSASPRSQTTSMRRGSAQGKGWASSSVLGPALLAAHVAAVSGVIANAGFPNIDHRQAFEPRPLDANGVSRMCIELSASGRSSAKTRCGRLSPRFTQEFDLDVAFQHDTVFRRNRRLVSGSTWIRHSSRQR